MFTGIVREVGRVEAVEGRGESVRLVVRAPETAAGTAVGDSVALAGVCLTAVEVADGTVAFDAVPETLEASLQLSEAALVDLGVAMGPVIASIHEKRDELRAQIKAEAELDEAPRLGGRRLRDLAQPVGSNRSTPAT